MGRKFERPKHPNSDRVDPFSDASGLNPFAGENDEVESSDDIFAPTETSPVREYEASDFETTVPHRGTLVFWMGVVGVLMAIVGCVGVTAITANDLGWDGNTSLASLAPFCMFGMLPALIALILGRQDSHAIRVGAMDSSGRSATTRGWLLGLAGTVIAAIASGVYIYQMFALST